MIALRGRCWASSTTCCSFGSDPGWSYSDMSGFGPLLVPWSLVQAVLGGVGAAAGRGGERCSGCAGGRRARGARLGWRAARADAAHGARRRPARDRAGAWAWAASSSTTPTCSTTTQPHPPGSRARPSTSAGTRVTSTCRSRGWRHRRLRVEIYPDRRTVEFRGSYRLVNTTAQADRHPAPRDVAGQAWRHGAVDFDRPARP